MHYNVILILRIRLKIGYQKDSTILMKYKYYRTYRKSRNTFSSYVQAGRNEIGEWQSKGASIEILRYKKLQGEVIEGWQ